MRLLWLFSALFLTFSSADAFAQFCFGAMSEGDMRERVVNGFDDVAFGERIDFVQAVYCAGRSVSGNWKACAKDIAMDVGAYFGADGAAQERFVRDYNAYGEQLDLEIGLSERYCAVGSNGISAVAWKPFLRWRRPTGGDGGGGASALWVHDGGHFVGRTSLGSNWGEFQNDNLIDQFSLSEHDGNFYYLASLSRPGFQLAIGATEVYWRQDGGNWNLLYRGRLSLN